MESNGQCQKEGAIASLQSDIKTIFKRMDEQLSITKAVYELAGEIKSMNTRLSVIESGQKELKEDVDEIKAAPGRKWNDVVKTVVTVVVTGVVVYLLSQLGI